MTAATRSRRGGRLLWVCSQLGGCYAFSNRAPHGESPVDTGPSTYTSGPTSAGTAAGGDTTSDGTTTATTGTATYPCVPQADPDLDPAFGLHGVVLAALPVWTEAHSLALASDGAIYLGGRSFDTAYLTTAPAFLLRYTDAGQPDPSWGDAGVVSGDLAWTPVSVRVTGDGRVHQGFHHTGPTGLERHEYAFLRYTSEGGLDPSWAMDGELTPSESGLDPDDSVWDAVADPTGGLFVLAWNGFITRVYRFTAEGTPDPAFGGAGFVDVPSADARLGPAWDGGCFLASYDPALDEVRMRHLGTDGAFDPNWGGQDGVLVASGAASLGLLAPAQGQGGQVVVAWQHVGTAVVQLLTAEGVPVPAFGGAHRLELAPPESFVAARVDSAGRVLLAGTLGTQPGVVRLGGDGLPDPTFSGDGIATPAVCPGYENYAGIELDSSDRLLVAGTFADKGFLMRMLP